MGLGSFIHQHDDEYESLKKARRPGRPGSAREDLLKIKIAALADEYNNGFGTSRKTESPLSHSLALRQHHAHLP